MSGRDIRETERRRESSSPACWHTGIACGSQNVIATRCPTRLAFGQVCSNEASSPSPSLRCSGREPCYRRRLPFAHASPARRRERRRREDRRACLYATLPPVSPPPSRRHTSVAAPSTVTARCRPPETGHTQNGTGKHQIITGSEEPNNT